jgi:hypothetical protein
MHLHIRSRQSQLRGLALIVMLAAPASVSVSGVTDS